MGKGKAKATAAKKVSASVNLNDKTLDAELTKKRDREDEEEEVVSKEAITKFKEEASNPKKKSKTAGGNANSSPDMMFRTPLPRADLTKVKSPLLKIISWNVVCSLFPLHSCTF